ncbi:glycosyltransferase family 4 protein [Smaragdicoccus niigatensis]|uniref:glycosyltransferase family 4 protein n=1 Tax=Smaragdicoccus niigatensis TaxID=359359 RepID=UPI0003635BAB|nr:glycosyltransferase family 4 protein [Smaragdicoccus niigatensis]
MTSANSRLRVLTVIDGFRMGGAETLLAPLVVAAPDADLDLELVGISGEEVNAPKTIEILRRVGIEPRSLGVRRLLDPMALPRLVREIKRSDCDVVHAHLEMAMSLAVPAGLIAGKPVVCTFHHVHRPLDGRAAKREKVAVAAASRSARAIFVSNASRISFQEAYRPKGLPANWEVVHNGIDISDFAPGAPDPKVRAELAGSSELLVVLAAAFRDFKGIPVAIDAWKTVSEQFPNAKLALVGGGEFEAQLRKQVDDLGLADRVTFAGVRADMPDVYRAADVIVLPSIYGENLPTVLIEAGASGRPVVATRVGGIPDIVADGETGLLVAPSDPADLAAALVKLLSDSALRERLGAAGTERIRKEFSANAWVTHLRAVYEAAIAGKKKRKKRS